MIKNARNNHGTNNVKNNTITKIIASSNNFLTQGFILSYEIKMKPFNKTNIKVYLL